MKIKQIIIANMLMVSSWIALPLTKDDSIRKARHLASTLALPRGTEKPEPLPHELLIKIGEFIQEESLEEQLRKQLINRMQGLEFGNEAFMLEIVTNPPDGAICPVGIYLYQKCFVAPTADFVELYDISTSQQNYT